MAKRYIYNNEVFHSEQTVRQAIWDSERKVFGEVSSVEEWAALGVVVESVDGPDEYDAYAEKVEEFARMKRDRLLAASDYYLMSDYPSTEAGLVEVREYRKTLRDISKQTGWPYDVSWPKLPEALRG